MTKARATVERIRAFRLAAHGGLTALIASDFADLRPETIASVIHNEANLIWGQSSQSGNVLHILVALRSRYPECELLGELLTELEVEL